MKRKSFAGLAILVFLVTMLSAVPTIASGPNPPGGMIAIDVDPYYKELTGNAAASIIERETKRVEAQLAEATASYGGVDAVGVGDVHWLYADGWREFTLRALGGNAEIWVANDLSYCPGDPRPPDVVTQAQIDYLLDEYNNTIYPSNTFHFGFTEDRYGTEGLFASLGYSWYETDTPQRMMILVYNIIDDSWCDPTYPFFVAGYFWPDMTVDYADRNIMHIDTNDWANRIGPGGTHPYDYEGTLAHEFEHAIHFDHDYNEEYWIDEGMADLAGYFAGYGHAQSHLAYYLVYHRHPLLQWLGGLEDYGQSYLFQLYLMENFGGPDFTKALIDEQSDGIAGVNKTLKAFGYPSDFDEVFDDWTIANYLDDPSLVGDSGAALGYDGLDIPSSDTWGYSIQWSIVNIYGSTEDTSGLPRQRNKKPVPLPDESIEPYAPSYFVYPAGDPELLASFDGDDQAGIAPPSDPYMAFGGYEVYAEVDYNTLTLGSPVTLGTGATLTFNTWYEIEDEWDFGFVQMSVDGGATWTSLENPHTTYNCDPSCAFGAELPGFTGSSGGWQTEAFDLSAYEGASALFRFNYATDWYTTWQGWYVDDVVLEDNTGVVLSDSFDDFSNWVVDDWELIGPDLEDNGFSVTFLSPDSRSKTGWDIIDMKINKSKQKGNIGVNTKFNSDGYVTVIVSNHLPEYFEYVTHFLLDLVDVGKK